MAIENKAEASNEYAVQKMKVWTALAAYNEALYQSNEVEHPTPAIKRSQGIMLAAAK